MPGRKTGQTHGPGSDRFSTANLKRRVLEGRHSPKPLYYLLGEDHKVDDCPNPDCNEKDIDLPKPAHVGACPKCGEQILPTDGLRIHTQFRENDSPIECHSRVRDTLEILALVNSLRYLIRSRKGRIAITNTAFVMDGQLAAFGTIAILAQAVRKELQAIQRDSGERISCREASWSCQGSRVGPS